MKDYKFLLDNGNIAEVTGDIRVDASGNHYVWSCEDYYEEDVNGNVVENTMGPISSSKCARYIRGAQLL